MCIYNLSFSQNVGIGTNTPATKLHVDGTASNIATFNGGPGMWITLAEQGTNRGYIGSYTGNPEDVDFGTYSGNPGKLHLTTANTPRLTVDASGKVGIGVTTPQQMLSVASGLVIDQSNLNTGTTTNYLSFGSNSGEGIGSKRSGGTNQYGLNFFTDSTQRMTITNAGRIGINNNTPSSRLTIYHESPIDARGYPNEDHGFMIIDSSYNLGTAALYMGVNVASNRAYITFNNLSYANGNIEPKLFINPMGNTTFIGGGWGSTNVPYKLVVENGNALFEEDVFVQDGKGIIRSADGTQRKQLVKIVTINTSFAAGETKSFGFTWPENFGAAPDAYVGAIAPGSSNGWAEMIVTVAADNSTGGTLFVYNPKSTSVSPNFNIKIIGIGAQ